MGEDIAEELWQSVSLKEFIPLARNGIMQCKTVQNRKGLNTSRTLAHHVNDVIPLPLFKLICSDTVLRFFISSSLKQSQNS